MNDTTDIEFNNAIRNSEPVWRAEIAYRQAAEQQADPIEFAFTPRGRHLAALIATERVQATLPYPKGACVVNVALTKIVQTCPSCPSQWDAWDADGTCYYIRFRWGWLSVTKNGVLDTSMLDGAFYRHAERFGWAVPTDIFGEQVSDGLDGTMTTDEMLRRTGLVLFDEDRAGWDDPERDMREEARPNEGAS